LTDVVPKDTSLFTFIEINEEFFSIYSTSLYTEKMHYPTQQLELLDVHQRVGETDYAVSATHWLEGFIDWSKPCTRDFLVATPPCVPASTDGCDLCDTTPEGIEALWGIVQGGEDAGCCLPESTVCFPYTDTTPLADLKYREQSITYTYTYIYIYICLFIYIYIYIHTPHMYQYHHVKYTTSNAPRHHRHAIFSTSSSPRHHHHIIFSTSSGCRDEFCRSKYANTCQMLALVSDPTVGSAQYGEFYNGKCDPNNLLTGGRTSVI
jgi:hypothetical protein